MTLFPRQPTEHPAFNSLPQMIADRRGAGVNRPIAYSAFPDLTDEVINELNR
jgi:hypothetical protein